MKTEIEIVNRIKELDKKGLLRDEVKKELAKESGESYNTKIPTLIIANTFPDKLFFLLKKYIACKKHLEKNKKDIVSNRQLLKKKHAVIRDLRYRSTSDSFYTKFLNKNNLDLLASTCQRYLVAHS